MKPRWAFAASVALTLTASACGSSRTNAGPLTRVSSNRVSESTLIEDGTVRCTVTVSTTPIQAGYELGDTRVVFTFHNISDHRVFLQAQTGSAILKSPDGTTYDPLWEAKHGPSGPVGSLRILRGATTPGATVYLP